MKRIALATLGTLLIVLTALFPACASPPEPLGTEADFIGFITGIRPAWGRGAPGEVSVESHADKIVARYIISLTDRTLIFRREGEELRRVGFSALEDKQWVEIWWAGPTTGTFPVLGTAAQIVIQ